ncbi:exotoxin beta-grasp domain-containing protein [Staphylococcus agnetis]|uniref:Exotoxin n=1 Tax=Staphylococcus agnetis TaxID=985762 RepID=A0AAW9YWH3_9STAP|nr:exotoxin beta-grasp domain-containing protein [Staphylococcus agnetis]NJI02320.1 exotoxin [Staphylococcus agnetis]PTH37120.1 exotoxin [Staphylococcus agnetis]
MFKKIFTLILSLVLIYPLLSNFCNANAEEFPKSEDLHKKSDVEHLNNVKHAYSFNNFVNEENKNTSDQFLANTLLFNNFFVSHHLYNDLLITFESDSLAKSFLNKQIDIYGVFYGYNCAGGKPWKTACVYGGVTSHENNYWDQEKNIPINLWVDDIKTDIPLTAVSTKKKSVTVQELDVKARKYLSDKYKLYELDSWGGRIQKGLIEFDSHGSNIKYDLYDIKGATSDEFLKIYQDNKTINTDKLHIDIYLYTK